MRKFIITMIVMLTLSVFSGCAIVRKGEEGTTVQSNNSDNIEETTLPQLSKQDKQEFEYEFESDNTISIIGYNGDKSKLEIPLKIDKYKVVKVAFKKEFKDNLSNVKTLVLPEGNITIGTCQGFCGNNSLTEIVFPESGEIKIDDYAFCECKGLKELNINETVKSIGTSAFEACSSLKKLSIKSNGELEIYDLAFSESGLSEIEFDGDLKMLYLSAFSNTDIKELTFPSIERIYGKVDCMDNLESVTFTLGKLYFMGTVASDCDNLKSIDFGDLELFNEYGRDSDEIILDRDEDEKYKAYENHCDVTLTYKKDTPLAKLFSTLKVSWIICNEQGEQGEQEETK